MSTIKTRYMKVVITLTQGTTFADGSNQVIINDNTNTQLFGQTNIIATINELSSNLLDSSADIRIVGLDKSTINTLSSIGLIADANFAYFFTNQIQLYAGYDNLNNSLAYQGSIARAYGDFSSPDRTLILQCSSTAFQNLALSPAVNPQGDSDIVQTYKSIADKLKLTLINNGVSGTIKNLVLQGGLLDQLRQLSKMTQTNNFIKNGNLYISDGKTATSTTAITIDPDSGMISYPKIDDWGIQLRSYFNPLIIPSQPITINSYVEKANGTWIVYSINSVLNNNGTEWFSDLKCVLPQYYGGFTT